MRHINVLVLLGHHVGYRDLTVNNPVSASTGPLAEVDAALFARKAIELAALPNLQELATKNSNPMTQRILLHLVCAAMAAFDLSPFTLPLPELLALVDTLAHLYEGTQLL